MQCKDIVVEIVNFPTNSSFKECFYERCSECSEEVDGNFCSKCERKLEAGVILLKEAADQVKRMDLSLKFEGGLEEEKIYLAWWKCIFSWISNRF